MENLNAAERLTAILSGTSPRRAEDILTDEVMEIYRATADEFSRARIAAKLREHAKASGVNLAGFDKMFKAFERNVSQQEKAEKANVSGGRRFASRENRVGIETTAEAIKALGISVRFNLLCKEMEVTGLPSEYSKDNAANVLPVYLMDYFKSRDFDGASIVNIESCLNCISDRTAITPWRNIWGADAGTVRTDSPLSIRFWA